MSESLSQVLNLPHTRFLLADIQHNLQPAGREAVIVSTIFNAADVVVDRLSSLDPNPQEDRAGGVLVVARTGKAPYVVARKVGTINRGNSNAESELDRNKADKYLTYALSKAAFMAMNQGLVFSSGDNKTISPTYRLNIEGVAVPAGAIKVMGRILSFSGFSMRDDEAVCLAAAVLAEETGKTNSLEIAELLDNARYPQIVDNLLA